MSTYTAESLSIASLAWTFGVSSDDTAMRAVRGHAARLLAPEEGGEWGERLRR